MTMYLIFTEWKRGGSTFYEPTGAEERAQTPDEAKEKAHARGIGWGLGARRDYVGLHAVPMTNARFTTTARPNNRGDRVVADLESWGVDKKLVDEVRQAFAFGDHKLAMELAKDLGWNRTSKRGRAPGSGRAK